MSGDVCGCHNAVLLVSSGWGQRGCSARTVSETPSRMIQHAGGTDPGLERLSPGGCRRKHLECSRSTVSTDEQLQAPSHPQRPPDLCSCHVMEHDPAVTPRDSRASLPLRERKLEGSQDPPPGGRALGRSPSLSVGGAQGLASGQRVGSACLSSPRWPWLALLTHVALLGSQQHAEAPRLVTAGSQILPPRTEG